MTDFISVFYRTACFFKTISFRLGNLRVKDLFVCVFFRNKSFIFLFFHVEEVDLKDYIETIAFD